MSFMAIYGWIIYFFLKKKNHLIKFCFWTFMALFFILISWMTPWYFMIIIALSVLLLQEKTYAGWMLLLTGYSLFHYVI